jgi:hypothetical protein
VGAHDLLGACVIAGSDGRDQLAVLHSSLAGDGCVVPAAPALDMGGQPREICR